jgi:putative membrane protein
MGEAERVLNTPLPLAYSVAFAQITLIYVYILPFQLYSYLGWITIPGTMIAAYIILGIATIGNELENPFGHDVNDLPLDSFCQELSAELNVITSKPAPTLEEFVAKKENLVLYPISTRGYADWSQRSIDDIRDALKAKSMLSGRKIQPEGSDKKDV